MLINRASKFSIAMVVVATLAACGDTPPAPASSAAAAISEVNSRQNRFREYPVAGWTYLSFNLAHGFQVNHIGQGGKAWLWFPGNTGIVNEEWKRDTIRGIKAICFRHPPNSRNPVTKTSGGKFQCQDLTLSQKSIVASLKGDPYNLRVGKIPYVLNRCEAPREFEFDRKIFGCR